MSDTAIRANCLFYTVQLNPITHEPIVTTMKAKPNNKLDNGYTPCNEGRLTPYQMTAPAGKKQCFPKSGLRYFYLFNNITKQIVPNSLVSHKGKKARLCIGTNTYLEYVIWG